MPLLDTTAETEIPCAWPFSDARVLRDLLVNKLIEPNGRRDRQGEGTALVNMGGTQLKRSLYPESLSHNQTALEIFCEIGYRRGEAEALKNLAELHQAYSVGGRM